MPGKKPEKLNNNTDFPLLRNPNKTQKQQNENQLHSEAPEGNSENTKPVATQQNTGDLPVRPAKRGIARTAGKGISLPDGMVDFMCLGLGRYWRESEIKHKLREAFPAEFEECTIPLSKLDAAIIYKVRYLRDDGRAGRKWQERIKHYRQEYEAELYKIPIASKTWRLQQLYEELQKIPDDYAYKSIEHDGEHILVKRMNSETKAKILEQARVELEGKIGGDRAVAAISPIQINISTGGELRDTIEIDAEVTEMDDTDDTDQFEE